MPSDYQRIDAGADDLGAAWAIGVCGAAVYVAVLPSAPGLMLGATRERFTRALITAEHVAEQAGPVVFTNRAAEALSGPVTAA
jgi:hypothetical protein